MRVWHLPEQQANIVSTSSCNVLFASRRW